MGNSICKELHTITQPPFNKLDDNDITNIHHDDQTTLTNKFKNYTFNNCKKKYDKPVQIYARVIDIYDGDTITCSFDESENVKMIKAPIRLLGIDTCEMKTTNDILENDTEHIKQIKKKAATISKKLAYDARDRIYYLITGKHGNHDTRLNIRKELNNNVYIVKLNIIDTDKYGRILADVTTLHDNKTLSEHLLEDNLAYKYNKDIKLKKLSTIQQVELLTHSKITP